jgi:hypothetical protein
MVSQISTRKDGDLLGWMIYIYSRCLKYKTPTCKILDRFSKLIIHFTNHINLWTFYAKDNTSYFFTIFSMLTYGTWESYVCGLSQCMSKTNDVWPLTRTTLYALISIHKYKPVSMYACLFNYFECIYITPKII